MRFSKYHGTGNDFVMVSDLAATLGPATSLPRELVAAICDRHTGVGADGIVRVISGDADPEARSAGAAVRMDYYNADGDPAGMCGNGIRCLAALERKVGRFPDGTHLVHTGSRVVAVEAVTDTSFRVDMGTALLEREAIPIVGTGPSLRITVDLDGTELVGTGVNMGNPHFVLFTSDLGRPLDDSLVSDLGPRLEHHPDFPERTNVEFVEVVGATRIRARVWERGVGETMASGSGGSAAAVASAALERTGPHLVVDFPGGELEIDWTDGGTVFVTGPAEEVFEGEIDRAWLAARGLDAYASLVAT